MDFAILDWIQANLRCGLLDAVLPVLTRLGDAGAIWIALGVVLTAIPRTRRYGAAVLAALLIDVILCNGILKPLVNRARPFALREVALLVPPPGDPSFPSGHSAAAFSATFALVFSKAPKRLWIPALALAVVIAFSRLYLYLHFPTDVAAGAALGVVFGLLGALCVRITVNFRRRRHGTT